MNDSTFSELIREAQELGIQYNGDDMDELEGFVQMARIKHGKEHPVKCYGLSYDPSDRRCRICQLKNPCADIDKRPRIQICEVAQLQPIPCDVCQAGSLEVECVDIETRELRDYACSNTGCQNSVSIQCGWENTVTAEKEIVIVEKKHKAEKSTAEKKTEETKEGPALRVIKGEKKTKKKTVKKKTTKKKTVVKKDKAKKETVVKKGKAKAPVKKTATKKSVIKEKSNVVAITDAKEKSKKNGYYFVYKGIEYSSLTAVVQFITQSRNWNVLRFFGIRPEMVQAGQVLERDYEGHIHRVEVKK